MVGMVYLGWYHGGYRPPSSCYPGGIYLSLHATRVVYARLTPIGRCLEAPSSRGSLPVLWENGQKEEQKRAVLTVLPQRSDGRRTHPSAQSTLTIGNNGEETLRLSNLSTFTYGKTGVTLRRVSYLLSHLRVSERLRGSPPMGFSRLEPRALPVAHRSHCGHRYTAG